MTVSLSTSVPIYCLGQNLEDEIICGFFMLPYAEKLRKVEEVKARVAPMVQNGPNNSFVHLCLGEVALLEQDLDAAKYHFSQLERAYSLDTTGISSSYLNSRAGYFRVVNADFAGAVQLLTFAKSLDDEDPVTLCCLSRAAMHERGTEWAIPYLESALKLYPEDPLVRLHYAHYLSSSSQPVEELERFLEESAELHPDYMPINYFLGTLTSDMQKAEICFQRAADHPNALNNPYGRLAHIRLGRLPEVLDKASEAQELIELLDLLVQDHCTIDELALICRKITTLNVLNQTKAKKILKRYSQENIITITRKTCKYLLGEEHSLDIGYARCLYLLDSNQAVARLALIKIYLGEGGDKIGMAERHLEYLKNGNCKIYSKLQPIHLELQEKLKRLQDAL